jgi:hypothetical protein
MRLTALAGLWNRKDRNVLPEPCPIGARHKGFLSHRAREGRRSQVPAKPESEKPTSRLPAFVRRNNQIVLGSSAVLPSILRPEGCGNFLGDGPRGARNPQARFLPSRRMIESSSIVCTTLEAVPLVRRFSPIPSLRFAKRCSCVNVLRVIGGSALPFAHHRSREQHDGFARCRQVASKSVREAKTTSSPTSDGSAAYARCQTDDGGFTIRRYTRPPGILSLFSRAAEATPRCFGDDCLLRRYTNTYWA